MVKTRETSTARGCKHTSEITNKWNKQEAENLQECAYRVYQNTRAWLRRWIQRAETRKKRSVWLCFQIRLFDRLRTWNCTNSLVASNKHWGWLDVSIGVSWTEHFRLANRNPKDRSPTTEIVDRTLKNTYAIRIERLYRFTERQKTILRRKDCRKTKCP